MKWKQIEQPGFTTLSSTAAAQPLARDIWPLWTQRQPSSFVMENEQNKKLNSLIAEQGSVAEKTRIASELPDEQLQMAAAARSRYASKELERRRAEQALQAQNRWYTRPVGMVPSVYTIGISIDWSHRV